MHKKLRNRKHFYLDCIQYVKKRQDGFIHPRDTSYVGLVKALERFTGIVNGNDNENLLPRAKLAASKLGIALPTDNGTKSIRQNSKAQFYSSLAWKKLRYATLTKYGAKCQCCGASGKNVPIRVDHIRPISKYWHLRLDPRNVQVLCGDCNWGKLDLDETDWREV